MFLAFRHLGGVMAAKNNEQGTNNLRDCITKIRYLEINREEQHLGALLFSFLIDQENRKSFIQLVREKEPNIDSCFDEAETEVYFEFAMPRDIWKRMEGHQKHAYICNFLNSGKKLPHIKDLRDLPQDDRETFNREFNSKFKEKPSKEHIESPGNWNLVKLVEYFSKRPQKELRRAAMLKWAFNAKPDIVLINGESVLSLELKFESDFSSYPASGQECKNWDESIEWENEFKTAKNGKHRIRQLELQRFLLEEVLGYKHVRQLVVKNQTSRQPRFSEYPHGSQQKPYQFVNWQDIKSIVDRNGFFYQFMDENLILNPRAR